MHALKGRIIFTKPVHRGMLKIGITDAVRSYHNKSLLRINGTLLCGDCVTLRRGIAIEVTPEGCIELQDHVYIGDNNTIISKKKITIGYATRVGNSTTFMDTDFHYIVNTMTGDVKSSYGEIFIGENNWIGGNCIIKKGAHTPKGTILAGPYSMISKDYRGKINEYSIIGGSPAKLLIENMRRINNDKYQKILSDHFKKTNDVYCFGADKNFDEICLPQTN